jgi:hypothetical protein
MSSAVISGSEFVTVLLSGLGVNPLLPLPLVRFPFLKEVLELSLIN